MIENLFKRNAPKPEPSDEEIAKQRAGRFGAIGAVIGGALVAKDILTASPAQAQEWPEKIKQSDLWKMLSGVHQIEHDFYTIYKNYSDNLPGFLERNKDQINETRLNIFKELATKFYEPFLVNLRGIKESLLQVANSLNQSKFDSKSIDDARGELFRARRNLESAFKDFEAIVTVESWARMNRTPDEHPLSPIYKKLQQLVKEAESYKFNF